MYYVLIHVAIILAICCALTTRIALLTNAGVISAVYLYID